MAKPPQFWNDRFDTDAYVYGTAPNAFIEQAAQQWLTTPQDVLDLGAGEGRNAVFLAQQGHTVTAVDASPVGLQKTQRLAREAGTDLTIEVADVTDWRPSRTWDVVVCTFLHLAPDDQPGLYRTIQAALHPGGVLLAEWFRPEQITEGYDSGGPPDVAMMVTPDDLRAAFPTAGIEHLEAATPTLDEGPHHSGPGATVQFVWRKPA